METGSIPLIEGLPPLQIRNNCFEYADNSADLTQAPLFDDLPMLSHAQAYAELKYDIVPIHPGSKSVCLSGAYSRASHYLPTIRSHWGDWPDAGIGIRTGYYNQLAVIDIDPRQPRCHSELKELLRKYGPFPRTVMSHTNRGGLHLYYRLPNLPRLVNGDLADGIELKCNTVSRKGGAGVIAPPSIGPDGRYSWWPGCSLGAHDVTPLPAWIATQQREHRAFKQAEKDVERQKLAREGGRKNFGSCVAGAAVGHLSSLEGDLASTEEFGGGAPSNIGGSFYDALDFKWKDVDFVRSSSLGLMRQLAAHLIHGGPNMASREDRHRTIKGIVARAESQGRYHCDRSSKEFVDGTMQIYDSVMDSKGFGGFPHDYAKWNLLWFPASAVEVPASLVNIIQALRRPDEKSFRALAEIFAWKNPDGWFTLSYRLGADWVSHCTQTTVSRDRIRDLFEKALAVGRKNTRRAWLAERAALPLRGQQIIYRYRHPREDSGPRIGYRELLSELELPDSKAWIDGRMWRRRRDSADLEV